MREAVAAADRLRHRVRECETEPPSAAPPCTRRAAAPCARRGRAGRRRRAAATRRSAARRRAHARPRRRCALGRTAPPRSARARSSPCRPSSRAAGRASARRRRRFPSDAHRAAAAHLPLGVANAVERRPLRAGVRRRHGHERHVRCCRDRLAEVDGAATADGDHAAAGLRGCVVDAFRRHLESSGVRIDRQSSSEGSRRGAATSRLPRRTPPAGRRAPSERSCEPGLSRTRRTPARRASRRGPPSGRARSRAKARARRRGRRRRVPAATSASIAEREMNVTPKPPSTALRADSCRPSSRRTSRSRRRTPALAQLVVDHLPNAGSLLHQHDRLRLQLVERHRTVREAVPVRHSENHFVAEEGLEDDAAVTPLRRRRRRARARGARLARSPAACRTPRARRAPPGGAAGTRRARRA